MADWVGWVIGTAIGAVLWLLGQVYAAGPATWIIAITILLVAGSLRMLRWQVYHTGDVIAHEIKALVEETRNLKTALGYIRLDIEIEEMLGLLLEDERERRGYVFVCSNKACEAYGQKQPWLIPGSEDRPQNRCEKCHLAFEWIRLTPPR